MADPIYSEGSVVVNPSTGAELMLQGGKWVDNKPTGKIPSVQPDQPDISVTQDILKSAGPELERGFTGLMTSPPTIAGLLAQGASKGSEYLPDKIGEPIKEKADKFKSWMDPISYPNVQDKVEKASGGLYSPQTLGGQVAGHGIQFLPGMFLGGGGGLAARGATTAGAALGSELGGQAAKAFGKDEYAPYAELIGALRGGKMANAPRRLVTPYPAEKKITDLGDLAKSKGINLTAGQYTKNPELMQREANLMPYGPGTFKNLPPAQAEEVSQALLSHAGVPKGQPAIRPVLKQAGTNIGDKIEGLKKNTKMDFDADFVKATKDARDTYYKDLGKKPDPADPHAVDTRIQEIFGNTPKAVRMGLNGSNYHDLRSTISKQAQDLYDKGDSAGSRALNSLRDALDTGMERSLKGTPNEGKWREAFDQWGAYKSIKSVVGKSSKGPDIGVLDPNKVHTKAISGSPLEDTAYAASKMAQPHPPKQEGKGGLSTLLGSLLGGAAGHYLGTIGGGVEAAILGGINAPSMEALSKYPKAMTAKMMFSDLGQKYLANQLLKPGNHFDPKTARRLNLTQAAQTPYKLDQQEQ
jgi:hypothetical protein